MAAGDKKCCFGGKFYRLPPDKEILNFSWNFWKMTQPFNLSSIIFGIVTLIYAKFVSHYFLLKQLMEMGCYVLWHLKMAECTLRPSLWTVNIDRKKLPSRSSFIMDKWEQNLHQHQRLDTSWTHWRIHQWNSAIPQTPIPFTGVARYDT